MNLMTLVLDPARFQAEAQSAFADAALDTITNPRVLVRREQFFGDRFDPFRDIDEGVVNTLP